MSLERMFEDLEARMDHLENEERRAVAEELTRAERSQIPVLDRLRGAVGVRLGVRLRDGGAVDGELADVGADWIRLRGPAAARSTWVPLGAVAMIDALPERSRDLGESRLRPPGLGHELRALARDRALVQVSTGAGDVRGRLAAVGRDALDLRVLPTGEQVAAAGAGRVTILMAAIRWVVAEQVR